MPLGIAPRVGFADTRPMANSAYLRCGAGCPGRYDVFDIIYRCPQCQGLLEVGHPTDLIAAHSGEAWGALFRSRRQNLNPADRSGVWRHREWVLPQLDPAHIVSLQEGNAPLFQSERLSQTFGLERLDVKLCGQAHTGSFKDLGMTVLVSVVNAIRAQGRPIQAIACASTGDTSAALAAYGAHAGIPTAVLLPKGKITPAQLVQPMAHGARVLELETDFDGCMAMVRALCEHPDSPIYLANSLNALRMEGQKTVAFEVFEDLGEKMPDWIVIPGGNLGNVSALAAGLDQLAASGRMKKKPRLCVAQAAAANPLYRSYQDGFQSFTPVVAQETKASAIRIGNPVSIHRAIRALKRYEGVVEQADENELADASARADRTGLLCCPHTGVALAAVERLRNKGTIASKDHVVVVSTAHGLKFSSVSAAYHNDPKAAYRNAPETVPAERDAIYRALGIDP